MPTTYSTSLRLSLIATGEQAGTWGTTTNTNLGTLLEQAITGYVSVSMTDANYTLTTSNGSSDEARNISIKVVSSGSLTATRVVIIPNVEKTYYFWNATSGSQLIRIGTASSPTTYVDIPNGYGCYVFCDGSNAVYQQSPFINASTGAISLSATSVTTLSASSTVTGTSLIPSGSSVPTNGIYLPASNTVGVSTSSTARFYFGPSGQIGIGGATYGTSGQALLSGGASAAPTWGDVVTSVGQSFTGGLISVTGSPITSSGTLALTVAGTSGGIPYFSSGTTWASSGALAANAIVIGGGAGAAPSTTTTGTGVLTAAGNAVNTNGGLLTMPSTPSNGQLLIGNGTNYTNATITAGTGIAVTNGSGSITVAQSSNGLISALEFVIDGGGATLTTGIKGDLEIPFACTITQWTLLADQSGSVVVDIWKDTYANYPPTVADTITASAKPTITSSTKGQSSTLTGWTTSVSAGDTIRFNIDSVTTIQRVTISLKVTRT